MPVLDLGMILQSAQFYLFNRHCNCRSFTDSGTGVGIHRKSYLICTDRVAFILLRLCRKTDSGQWKGEAGRFAWAVCRGLYWKQTGFLPKICEARGELYERL